MRIPALILLFTSLFAAGIGERTNADRQESVQEMLDRKEQQLEQLYSVYWEIQYRMEQGDTTASDKKVQRKLRDVLNDPTFLDELKRSHFAEPVLQRRRQLFLEVAADSQISTDTELAGRVESIRKASSAKRYKIGEKRLERPELDNTIAHSSDRNLRRNAWYAQAELTDLTGDQIRQVIKLRNKLGTRYANRSFTDFMLERRATNRRDLTNWFEQIRTASEPEYRTLLSRAQQDLRFDSAEPLGLAVLLFNPHTRA